MIPIRLQPEPEDFNEKVREKGHAWLIDNSIALNAPPPDPAKLPTYWSYSNKKLWDAYSGVCAYLAIYFEWSTGASSTDHFIAKSRHAGDAYEWDNYRLSCLGANRNKNKFDDVLDPIGLAPDILVLNLATGEIKPNSNLELTDKELVLNTVNRLKLNSPENKQMRTRHYSEYLKHKVPELLKFYSPFVWYEANRQRLL